MAQSARSIDITGNWTDLAGFEPHIRTREPLPAAGELRAFHQELSLPPGEYRVELHYDVLLDKSPGWSTGGENDFAGLSVNGEHRRLRFEPVGSGGTESTAACPVKVTRSARLTSLRLELPNTRVMRTSLHAASALPAHPRYRAIPPAAGGEHVLCHGIPFLMRKLDVKHIPPYIKHRNRVTQDRGSLAPWREGMEFECGGAPALKLHFLGMIHNLDIANGSWYSPKGDHGYSHFVGDQAGEIEVVWDSGHTSTIPLVFGFNLWYGKAWDVLWHYVDYTAGRGGDNFDSTLFGGRNEYRDVIREGVSLVDGIRLMGSDSCNARFIFSVATGGRRVRGISVRGSRDLYDYPVISAITVERGAGAVASEAGGAEAGSPLVDLPLAWEGDPSARAVGLEEIEPGAFLPAVERIQRVLYTFVEDLPALSAPAVPEGYFGPRFDFRGDRDAVYAATYLYRNGPECAAYIADSGTGCSSSTANLATVHYTEGMGVWYERKSLFGTIHDWFRLYRERAPGALPGAGNAWTRGVGELLRESMAFGYDKFVDSYVDWLDACLFTEATPPHWVRIAGLGPKSEGFHASKVGDIEETGNRENDGHGICMWGRYMMWHWKGRPRSWNQKRFAVTRAAVEWIQWQLDTDTLRPGARKDVLYTESECAHGDYDIYSSFNCLHGIKLSIRMALQLGEDSLAGRWTVLYRRLRKGILDHLVDDSPLGPVWHTEDTCDWQDHAHKLVPLHLATEGDTYTPLQDYARGDDVDRRYLEISRSTYRYLMKDRNYNCLRMYGYGQGMMTQAALLLDEMEDAERFLDLMLRYCYLPRMEGWASPEGIIVHRSAKYYLPVNGYMGQDSHVADSTKAVRMLLGVDDNDPEHLRIVPRFPAKWSRLSIAEYPVLTGPSRQLISYTYERSSKSQSFRYAFREPVPRLSLRFGPLPRGAVVTRARYGGSEVALELEHSGDSDWVWVRDVDAGTEGELALEL